MNTQRTLTLLAATLCTMPAWAENTAAALATGDDYVNAIDDLGGSSGAASSGGYKIPFVKFVNSGTVYYINLYTS